MLNMTCLKYKSKNLEIFSSFSEIKGGQAKGHRQTTGKPIPLFHLVPVDWYGLRGEL